MSFEFLHRNPALSTCHDTSIASNFDARERRREMRQPSCNHRTDMELPHEAAPAETNLCELLDALEAGLLHMRRERDELRETLARSGRQSGRRPAAKTRAAKTTRTEKINNPQVSAPDQTEPESPPQKPSKKPSKPRQALGRTLNQIRTPREPGH
jgi:hypothetical protein